MIPWQVGGACAKNGMYTIFSMSWMTIYYAAWIEGSKLYRKVFYKGGLSYDISRLFVAKHDNLYHMR
jgi:hypothetical protein